MSWAWRCAGAMSNKITSWCCRWEDVQSGSSLKRAQVIPPNMSSWWMRPSWELIAAAPHSSQPSRSMQSAANSPSTTPQVDPSFVHEYQIMVNSNTHVPIGKLNSSSETNIQPASPLGLILNYCCHLRSVCHIFENVAIVFISVNIWFVKPILVIIV